MEQITSEEEKEVKVDTEQLYTRYRDEDVTVIKDLEHHEIVTFNSSIWWMHFMRATVNKDEYVKVTTPGTGGWPVVEYYKKTDTEFKPVYDYTPKIDDIAVNRERNDPPSPVCYKVLSPDTDYIFGDMLTAVLYRSKTRYLARKTDKMKLGVKPAKKEQE